MTKEGRVLKELAYVVVALVVLIRAAAAVVLNASSFMPLRAGPARQVFRSRPVRIGRAWLTRSRQPSLRSGQRGGGEVGIQRDTDFISSDPCVSRG